jgi:hypothetical protein
MLAGVLAFTLNSQIRGNAEVTKFLFLPSGQLVLQICAGPQISGRDGMMFVMASSEFLALERTWAKSFNLSRSVI